MNITIDGETYEIDRVTDGGYPDGFYGELELTQMEGGDVMCKDCCARREDRLIHAAHFWRLHHTHNVIRDGRTFHCVNCQAYLEDRP